MRISDWSSDVCSSDLGHYLCKLTPDGERADLVATILARLESSNERYWIGCLQGVLQALADDEREVILRTLVPGLDDAAALTLVKYDPFEGSTWSLLTELRPDLQVPYWREVVQIGRASCRERVEEYV